MSINALQLCEWTIQNELDRMLSDNCQAVVPNYTPLGWFECDIFAVSRTGYFTEYEIKRSVRDFDKDIQKGQRKGRSKHKRLSDGDPAGPTRFFFVVDLQTVEIVQVPKWAGLIVAEQTVGGGIKCRTVSRAPRLHNLKIEDSDILHSRMACQSRLWNERMRNERRLRTHGL